MASGAAAAAFFFLVLRAYAESTVLHEAARGTIRQLGGRSRDYRAPEEEQDGAGEKDSVPGVAEVHNAPGQQGAGRRRAGGSRSADIMKDSAARPGGVDLPPRSETSMGYISDKKKDRARLSPTAQLLTHGDLKDIYSIDCLQKRQRGLTDEPCGNKAQTPNDHAWYVGYYPKYDTPTCNSDGEEKYCDADAALNATERHIVLASLNAFRKNHLVKCQTPGTGNEEYFPFGLGVALLRTLPSTELDQESLEKFGQSVLAEWGLLEGSCANSAVLVIATAFEQATFSAPSCEFVCASRGGESIIIRMKAQLEMQQPGSVFKAVMDGIEEFRQVIMNTPRLAQVLTPEFQKNLEPTLSPAIVETLDETESELEEATGGGPSEAPPPKNARKDVATYASHREATAIILQRLAMIGLVVGAVVSVFVLGLYAFWTDVTAYIKSHIHDIAPWYVDPSLVTKKKNYLTFDDKYEGAEEVNGLMPSMGLDQPFF